MANTGNKIYTILRERVIGTGVYTGVTKPNLVSDPDYVAPVIDLTTCPITTTTTTTTTSTTTTTTSTLTTHDVTISNLTTAGSGYISNVLYSPNVSIVPSGPLFPVYPSFSVTQQIMLNTPGGADITVQYVYTSITPGYINLYKNSILIQSIPTPSPSGSVTFTGVSIIAGDVFDIKFEQ